MATAMKHMASNFAKLKKFKGVDFRRWQKKMHFLLSSMSVVYVPTTSMPEDGGDNPTVDQVRRRAKWDNDDYVCRGLILNGMSDSLFDIYQNVETSKELWDTLEAKYMAEDASSKKFLVSNFTNYKMTNSRPVLEQYNELLGILGRFTQHKMNMDESIQDELTLVELGSHLRIEESLRAQDNDKPKGKNVVGPSVVNMVEHNNSSRYNDNKGKRKHHDTKADPNKKQKVTCWKCGKSGHLKKDCKAGNDNDVAWWTDSGATVHACKDRCWFKTYESLNDGSILHLEMSRSPWCMVVCFEQLWLNIVSNNIGSAFMSTSKLNNSIIWHARLSHVHFKKMQDMSKDGLISAFDMDTEKCKTYMLTKITKKPFQNVKRETKVLELIHSDLCDVHATPSLGNKKYFVTFIDDASRAVVRLPDQKLKTLGERGIKCIFVGYVPRPSQRYLVKGTEDSGGSVVSEKVTEDVVLQHEPELRKSKRHGTPKDFGPEFQLYLIEGTRDEVSDQHSYCFNIEDDPKNFDEAMKSQDVAFWKEAINDEMDSIMGNNTWVLADLPLGCKPLGCKWIFKRKLKVDGTVEKFKARLVIQGFKQKSGIDYFNNYALVACISTIRLLIAMASIHSLIIHQMDVKTAL
ncbi:zinc finger, CCHC-type containing protein [Tanacetum coccineum]